MNEPDKPEEKKKRILVVEDDPVTLKYHTALIKSLGYECLSAGSVVDAQDILSKNGIHTFDCVITDYLMPVQTGMELLNWLREKSSSLAAIVVSAQEERNLIAESLRVGAADFLDKPVSINSLKTAVEKACKLTAKWRTLHAHHEAVRGLVQFREVFCNFRSIEGQNPPELIFFPKYELGGDFVNIFPINDHQFVLLCGDVSGHDLTSAYASSYFQGIVRGLSEKNTTIVDIIQFFNKTLLNEWNDSAVPGRDNSSFSIAVVFVIIDRVAKTVSIFNCGFPTPLLEDGHGRTVIAEKSSQPLGWFDPPEFYEQRLPADQVDSIIIFTDGIVDLAHELGIWSCSLAYRLMHEKDYRTQSKLVEKAQDDILIIRLKPWKMEQEQEFEIILSHVFRIEDRNKIDEHQATLERSLSYALPLEIFTDRFYDIIVCCREAINNGLQHGCIDDFNSHCTLQVSYCKAPNILRIRVDDTGEGHDFDIDQRIRDLEELKEHHLGLVMIKTLSDNLIFENNGASITFDFHLSIKK